MKGRKKGQKVYLTSPAIRTTPLKHADCGGELQLLPGREAHQRQCTRCGAIVEMGKIERRDGIAEVRYPKRRETLGQARKAIDDAEWLGVGQRRYLPTKRTR